MEKLWLTHYQSGVPHQISTLDYTSLIDVFNQSCQRFQDRKAYSNCGSHITYAELEQSTRHLAAYFQSLSLSPNARIAIMLPNCLQYPIALFAILRAGFIVVNTNPLYTPTEIAHQLNDAGAEAVIVFSHVAYALEKALPQLPKLKHIIVTHYGDGFAPVKRVIINHVVKHIKKMVPAFKLGQAINWQKALKQGAHQPFVEAQKSHQDVAFLQYTGGTTGIAKAAMLTHGNMIANVLQASAWIKPLHVNTEDTIITALPLYHIFSLTANCLTFFLAGAQNILITNPRDIKTFIKDIKNVRFTAITGVNTLFNALLHHKAFTSIDFSNLKLALSGGMSLHRQVAELWQQKTHAPILEAYGLTETSPAVTINPLNLKAYNGSIGLPLPGTDVSIRNDVGQEVALGEPGELCVKGPQVMLGYWQRPDETALVFYNDGYLKTGDIVKMDEQGFIYLIDRKKEMILVSGFNVYPNEIEHVIGQLSGVLEVGVIGVKSDDGSEERVKACIVKSDDNLTTADVKAHCRQYLTPYKVPKIIEFYDELPKSNIGKILRRSLK